MAMDNVYFSGFYQLAQFINNEKIKAAFHRHLYYLFTKSSIVPGYFLIVAVRLDCNCQPAINHFVVQVFRQRQYPSFCTIKSIRTGKLKYVDRFFHRMKTALNTHWWTVPPEDRKPGFDCALRFVLIVC